MSAAEPAPPVGAANHAPTARVIDIKTGRDQEPSGPERWTMNDTPPPDPAGQPDSSERLAEHLETTFNDNGHSLTDPETKEVFALTLKVVAGMHAAALAKGIVDQMAYDDLKAMIEGVAAAPGLIG